MGHSSLAVSLTYLIGLEVSELEESDMPMVKLEILKFIINEGFYYYFHHLSFHYNHLYHLSCFLKKINYGTNYKYNNYASIFTICYLN